MTPSSRSWYLSTRPDRVARQVVAELDVARDREVRHPLDRPPAQLLLGERRAVLEHRGDLHVVLAQRRSATACTATSSIVGVRDERPLHLEARDVLAPPPQVVLLAVDEVEEAVLVEPAEVAGVEPEVAQHVDASPRAGASSRRTSGSGPSGRHTISPISPTGDLDVVVVDEAHVELVRRWACPPRRACSARPRAASR